MEVQRINGPDWVRDFSENAHKIVFGKLKPAEWDRIDFALLVSKDKNMVGYGTCREFDAKTLYLQYGGAFRGSASTSLSLPAYLAFVEWCQQRYENITTLVENNNFVYLKFAMKAGFKIIGVRNYQGIILLEHHLEGKNVANS